MTSKFIKLLSFFLVIIVTAVILIQQTYSIDTSKIQVNKAKYAKFLTAKMRSGFDKNLELIRQKQDIYQNIHREIAAQITEQHLSFQELQEIYSAKLGFRIDLYRINSDYIITESTFEKDLNLDFKEPYFIDAQAALIYADKFNVISVGVPTLEITSGIFKTYSISKIENGNFLEVGFEDPTIGEIYAQIYDNLKHFPYVIDVELFVSRPSGTVSPFSLHSHNSINSQDKLEQLAEHAARLENDTAIFSDVTWEHSQIVESNDTSKIYLEIGTAKLTPYYETRYLAKVISDINFDKNIDITQ